eukprot:SAG11_NODE_10846_length_802_cov_0.951636_2_plen_103_part_01
MCRLQSAGTFFDHLSGTEDQLHRWVRSCHASSRPPTRAALLCATCGGKQPGAGGLGGQGYSAEVGRAGLFHSVYGTEGFGGFTLPTSRRAEVAAAIGKHAERL